VSAFPKPEGVLPHRAPFLFVDSIVALEPGVSAAGLWHLTGDEHFFAGHFPGRPTLPGVLMCEAIAQTAGIAMLTAGQFAGKLGLFGGLDGARFRKQVVPGDTLRLEATMGRMSARACKATGRALIVADGKPDQVACECEMMFLIVDA
jgi:3-hydroxyacyl-[acyl-carrier-protein] dehydratase